MIFFSLGDKWKKLLVNCRNLIEIMKIAFKFDIPLE